MAAPEPEAEAEPEPEISVVSQALARQLSQNFTKNPSQSPFPLITAVTTTDLEPEPELEPDPEPGSKTRPSDETRTWKRILGEWKTDLRDFLEEKMWEMAARGMAEAEVGVEAEEEGSQMRRWVVRMRRPDFKREK